MINLKKINIKWERRNKYNNNINVVLLMLPQHGNLGDHAITLAEIKFLKSIFQNIIIIYNLDNYSKYIHNNSIIFLQGGGNMGSKYILEEINRRNIIQAYPNIPIIIFPQTIFFENKKEEFITKNIYSNHKRLTLMARERESFNIMKKLFKNNTILFTPDIVTYLDNFIDLKSVKRNGALFILRNDNETILNLSFKNKMYDYIKKIYNNISITDNHIYKDILTLEESRKEVSQKLKLIASHDIVITDRLHGMIFSVITQTSCIVLRNYNYKISSSFEWFKNLNYIKFLDCFNIKKFELLVDMLKHKKTKNIYDKNIFNQYYNNIIRIIIKNFLN